MAHMLAGSSRLTPSPGIFAGSTPDPAAWNYNPQRRIGGTFVNMHGGSFEQFRYSSTAGVGVDMSMGTTRPFSSLKTTFPTSAMFPLPLYADRPAHAEPFHFRSEYRPGSSMLSLRVQVHPRVTLDITDNHFLMCQHTIRHSSEQDSSTSTSYQGINGGARIQFPRHITGYSGSAAVAIPATPRAR